MCHQIEPSRSREESLAVRRNRHPPPDPVEDKKKREYLSLFADNLAFTYTKR